MVSRKLYARNLNLRKEKSQAEIKKAQMEMKASLEELRTSIQQKKKEVSKEFLMSLSKLK